MSAAAGKRKRHAVEEEEPEVEPAAPRKRPRADGPRSIEAKPDLAAGTMGGVAVGAGRALMRVA